MPERKHHRFPELRTGIRVQYVDRDGALRAERIHSRNGNTVTVINALKGKKRIPIERIRGYWQPRVKATPDNLIRIR